jgi:hypothetical protein
MATRSLLKKRTLFVASKYEVDSLIDSVKDLLSPLGIGVQREVAEAYDEAVQKIKASVKNKLYDLIFANILVPPQKINIDKIVETKKIMRDGSVRTYYDIPGFTDRSVWEMITYTGGLAKLCKKLKLSMPIIFCHQCRGGISTPSKLRLLRYKNVFGTYFYPFSKKNTKELQRIISEAVLK